jgi:hypothetical protein
MKVVNIEGGQWPSVVHRAIDRWGAPLRPLCGASIRYRAGITAWKKKERSLLPVCKRCEQIEAGRRATRQIV